MEAALDMARKGSVLLKNDGILPLDKSKLKTIVVIGPNADSRVALIGDYHGTSSRYITVLEGIQDEVEDEVRVLYSEGCQLFKDKTENLAWTQDRISEAVITAENSDVVILCVGLDETLEGEEGDTGNSDASGDKKDLEFPASQQKLMDKILSYEKPVIVVNMAGSAMNLSVAQEKASAIIQAWYPGARGGKAVADVIFGVKSPSGKLPLYRKRAICPFSAMVFLLPRRKRTLYWGPFLAKLRLVPTLRSEEESLNRLNLAVVVDERSGKLLCVSADFANGGFDFVCLHRRDFFLGGFFLVCHSVLLV